MTVSSELRVFMMLCDYAQESGGKLFINGGGITQVLVANHPTQMGVAFKIRGPADAQPKSALSFALRLLDSAGKVVNSPNASGASSAVEVRGQLEPRAAAAAAPEVDAAAAINFVVALDAGAYEWRLTIENELKARWAFVVLGGATSSKTEVTAKVPR